MTPAKVERIEITLSLERAAALDAARGHEPRASFIKRALESALSASETREAPRDPVQRWVHGAEGGKPAPRGSVSPSLERFAKPKGKR